MNTNLFDPCKHRQDPYFRSGRTGNDSEKACSDYSKSSVSRGGRPPASRSWTQRTYRIQRTGAAFERDTLRRSTESTIEANKRFFESEDDVPRQAYTMGIKISCEAKKILVVVSGEDKAAILKEVLYGPITPEVPASILQLHNDVTIVADEAALSKIDM